MSNEKTGVNKHVADALCANAQNILREAESAWHVYASYLDLGNERSWAFEVYENVRIAQRDTETKL